MTVCLPCTHSSSTAATAAAPSRCAAVEYPRTDIQANLMIHEETEKSTNRSLTSSRVISWRLLVRSFVGEALCFSSASFTMLINNMRRPGWVLTFVFARSRSSLSRKHANVHGSFIIGSWISRTGTWVGWLPLLLFWQGLAFQFRDLVNKVVVNGWQKTRKLQEFEGKP